MQRRAHDLLAEGLVESIHGIGQVLHDLSTAAWLSGFVTSYAGILQRAEGLSGEIAGKLVSLIEGLEAGTISSGAALEAYVDAMSFNYEGQTVFMPCFSDNCFRDLARISPLRLSPFVVSTTHGGWLRSPDNLPTTVLPLGGRISSYSRMNWRLITRSRVLCPRVTATTTAYSTDFRTFCSYQVSPRSGPWKGD